jgi:hypothetical protein
MTCVEWRCRQCFLWLHNQRAWSQKVLGVNEILCVDLFGDLELDGPSAMNEVAS